MTSPRLVQFDSIDRLRAAGAVWDDLWQRSDTTLPTIRADLVALWLEHFASGAVFRALVVENGNRLLAALPLVERRTCGVVRCGQLTSNYWSPNGNLLVDRDAEADEIAKILAGAIESLDWPLLWFDMVPIEQTGWRALVGELLQRGLSVDVHPRWQVGQITWDGGAEAYFAARPKSLRRSLAKDARRLEETGPLEFNLEERFTTELVEARLREIFAVEDRGWKGEAGSSVLRRPAVFDFYRQQCVQLAEWDLLRVARLRHGDRTVAFELGWTGGGTYHSYKVSYDPEYRSFGPGHLLRERVVRALAKQGDVQTVDFQGPQNQALAAWSTGSYPIARVVIAQRRLAGRALWAVYQRAAKAVRLCRKMPRPW
ncbi:MAG TPA: GNAT family N-acetyltransferase [Thermoguttaceae bacterium]|nr:GNAT family N-acetyltransferase [Thermoguttaceae bacterium]